jgi:hypothetical protein
VKTPNLAVTINAFIADYSITKSSTMLLNGEQLVDVCRESKGKFVPVQAMKAHGGGEV